MFFLSPTFASEEGNEGKNSGSDSIPRHHTPVSDFNDSDCLFVDTDAKAKQTANFATINFNRGSTQD